MPRVNAHANPQVLVWAREERGFEVKEAAKKIRIKEDKLQRAESGEEPLTFPQLRRAAWVYRRPTAIFFLEETPPSLQIPEFRRLPSHEYDELSPELRLEVRKIHQRRKAANELEEYAPEFDWSFIGSISTKQDPEALGQEIRRILGIPEDFPVRLGRYQAFNYWRESIERLGTLVFLITGVEVEEMRGLTIAEKPFPIIAVNRKDPPEARSFSLLHEFCHILLAESSLCEIYDTQLGTGHAAWEIERFCNHVAGATLVPRDKLLQYPPVRQHAKDYAWSDDELTTFARRFRVSREVILRRLLILEKTTSDFYREKRQEWMSQRRLQKKSTRFGQPGHKRVLQVQGATFTNLVLTAFEKDAITAGDVSELLGMRLKHLPALRNLLEEHGA